MECSVSLRETIDELYAVFSRYPRPRFTHPCLCCHSLEDECRVHSAPLRELDPHDLRKYAASALLTWGDEYVFKHFLPRIYELVVITPNSSPAFLDPEMIFNKLRYGAWRTWPTEEQTAVEGFLKQVWHQVLSEPSKNDMFPDIESWLCSIGQCEEDLGPYLRTWLEDDSLSACLALSSFLLSSAIVLTGTTGRSSFWQGRDAQYNQVQQWATSSAVVEKMRLAEIRWSNIDAAEQFAMARSIAS
jgi:hypothetical protein